MKKFMSIVSFLLFSFFSFSQSVPRPKLVVGIVIDQMRWDYLYRYYDRYAANGGFKRLLSKGFTCENTLVPYIPTVTGAGHASIYTGSVPAINGITGNTWWDKDKGRSVYCTDDDSVKAVGSNSSWGKMSPKNLLVTSICDELRLATNFKSKVIGIAMKDRGCIFPAGHSANGVYWYDEMTGDWITSTFYMNDLPQWVKNFDAKRLVDKYFEQGWNTLYPIATYTESTQDVEAFESKPFGAEAKGFPYSLKNFIGKNYSILLSTPFGNTFTAEFAKMAIENENLGADNVTDFLALSFKATDYVGHAFGPNSVEIEDVYLRLDKDLGELFNFLDNKVGKEQYTVFLSADHGVAQVPEFLQENKIPGGRIFMTTIMAQLNTLLRNKYKIDRTILSGENFQLTFNLKAIDSLNLNKGEIIKTILDWLATQKNIARSVVLEDINKTTLPVTLREMISNGYYPRRCGEIQIIPQSNYFGAYSNSGTTHGAWNPYDAHIPLVWYGWGIKQGKLNRETYMTDIAPTLAALLHIQMPSGSIGKVIQEVMK